MKRKGKIGLLVAILVVIVAVTGSWFYIDSLAYKVCRVEAGIMVTPSDFLKTPDEAAIFTPKSQPFQITEPGEYAIQVKSGWFTHKCTLIIEDTQAPQGKPKDVMLSLGESATAQDFVTEVQDNTEVKITFAQAPDFTKPGKQAVKVLLTDKGSNALMLQAQLEISRVKKEVVWEVGNQELSVSDLLMEAGEAQIVTDMSEIDLNEIGDYKVNVQADGLQAEVLLKVRDTVAPQGTVQNISGFALLPREANEFLVEVLDTTDVTIAYAKEPDFTLPGVQTVELLLTDEGGNQTVLQAELNLEEDTESPVLSGVKDIVVYLGDTISYRKGVSASDNCEEGLVFEIDNSLVNPGEAGVYPVTYRATDLAGNKTEQQITVTIHARKHTLEEVNQLADNVLAQIITPEMTQLEIVQAIYNYNTRHIGYINHSDKGDWIQAAWEGLAKGKGDCYVYACTAKLLLTRAGITNMDIAKIPARTSHYWNLVDIGDGWYHFDTTPRKDHPTIFMWTDEQMMAYSNRHGKSHNYDPELYPEIN